MNIMLRATNTASIVRFELRAVLLLIKILIAIIITQIFASVALADHFSCQSGVHFVEVYVDANNKNGYPPNNGINCPEPSSYPSEAAALSACLPGAGTISPINPYITFKGTGFLSFSDGTVSAYAIDNSPDNNYDHDKTVIYTLAQFGEGCNAVQFFVAIPPIADNGGSCPLLCQGDDPVNPSSGSEYLSESDVLLNNADLLQFKRSYNSIDNGIIDQGPSWRHDYSRYLRLEYQYPQHLPPDTNDSSLYADAATACTSGWNEIKAKASNFQNATVSYANNVCTLKRPNGATQKLPIFNNDTQTNPVLQAIYATRDDGHLLKFTVSGSNFIAESGVNTRLMTVSSGYQLTDDNDTIEQYDSNGVLQSTTNRSGTSKTLTYDSSSGKLKTITDNFGHALTFGYDGNARLSTVSDPSNRITQYGYDNSGRLSTVTRPDASVRTYIYNDSNWPSGISSVLDENNQTVFTLAYDTYGRVTKSQLGGVSSAMTFAYNSDGSTTQTDAFGATRTFVSQLVGAHMLSSAVTGAACASCDYVKASSYDSAGFPSSKTDFNGNVTNYVYDDSRGLETSRTEAYGTPQARTITTTYSSTYRLPTEIDEPGRATTFTYDSTGNLLTKTVKDTATNAVRTWTYSSYTSWGMPQQIDGPRTDVSDITQIAYYNCTSGSQCGQVQTITDALSHVTTFNTYDANGRVLTYTDPNGLLTIFSYNSRGWLNTRQVGNESTTYTYDNAGQPKSITWPNGSSLTFTYDAAHRLTDVSDQLSNRFHYTLDAMGNHVGTDVYDSANNHVATHSQTYDTLNHLVTDIGAYNNESTTYGYDNNDNLTSVKDANNHQTIRKFDALDRLIKLTDPNNGVTNLTLNSLDQLTQVSDPRSVATSYSIDALGNVNTLTSPDSGATVSTYDAAGNRLTSLDANGNKTTFTYDALNRLTKTTFADGRNNNYSYDKGGYSQYYNTGHLTGIADNTGTTSLYYDIHGRVATKTVNANQKYFTTNYSYDGTSGKLTSMTLPSGKVLNYTWTNGKITEIAVGSTSLISNIVYQPFGAPKSWTLGNNESVTRTFDLDGRISGTAVSTVTYDAASRVSGITLGNKSVLTGSKTYGYDVLDRLNSYTSGSTSIGYSYDANGNLLTSTDAAWPVTYAIASNSNRIASATKAGTTTAYTYDSVGNLTKDINQSSYTYTMANQRSTGGSNYFVYNGLYQRAYKGNSSLTYFGYDESGKMIGEYASNQALIEETVWLGDMPVAVLEASGNYFIHTDQLNTPRQIDNAAGLAVWAWDTQTYGSSASNLPNQDPRNTGTQFVYNLRHPGQYYDVETGHMTNGFREYDPSSGRYVQTDPVGLAAGLNTYAYVGENPISRIDPYGLQAWQPGMEPPSNIPGGPWTPAGQGQRPGSFFGPKPPSGPRTMCTYVPDAKNGGPPNAPNGYWKTQVPGQDGWQRYDLSGVPGAPEDFHPGNPEPAPPEPKPPMIPPLTVFGVAGFFATYSGPVY